MDLGNYRESKNVTDHSNYINRRTPAASPAFDYFWRQMHIHPNDDSSIPRQTDPMGEGSPGKPYIPYHTLSDDEKTLVHDYDFRPEDIALMRELKVTPGQVMEGWKLQPQSPSNLTAALLGKH